MDGQTSPASIVSPDYASVMHFPAPWGMPAQGAQGAQTAEISRSENQGIKKEQGRDKAVYPQITYFNQNENGKKKCVS